MEKNLRRAYLIELIGTFALVYFGATVVCINHVATPANQESGTVLVQLPQPGLVGIALAQGLILAAVLAVTAPLSGGYLNPAITLMLWVFNRLDHVRTAWYIGAQLLGGFLAGLCVRYTFEMTVLASARVGTPHLNGVVFPETNTATLLTGTGIELVLTFFLVFAIFGAVHEGAGTRLAALGGGLALTAAVLVGFALTGAATNPARWFGTVLWEAALPRQVGEVPLPARPGAFGDMFVYLAGPIVGALLAGLVSFKLIPPRGDAERPAGEASKTGSTAIKTRRQFSREQPPSA